MAGELLTEGVQAMCVSTCLPEPRERLSAGNEAVSAELIEARLETLRLDLLRAFGELHTWRALLEEPSEIARHAFVRLVGRARERWPELCAAAWISGARGEPPFVVGTLVNAPGAATLRELAHSNGDGSDELAVFFSGLVDGGGAARARSLCVAAAVDGDGGGGWVLAEYDAAALFKRACAPLVACGWGVSIRESDEEGAELFVDEAGRDVEREASPWCVERDLAIGGRVWRVVVFPRAVYRESTTVASLSSAAVVNRGGVTLQEQQGTARSTMTCAVTGATADSVPGESRVGAAAQSAVLSETEARQWALAGLIGRGPRFTQMLREVRAVQSATRTTVLISGESGTGKELTARAIHYGGAQVAAPFVRVDCSTLPLEHAEAMIFGQVRGQGAGAVPERRGFCEQAEGGTLFFDEIGDLPLALQAKLLRVLEDGAYLPLGATAPRTVHARVIAATHADLPALIAAGRFRNDLYYRLMHYHIVVPALRDRLEDVPALAQHFVRVISAELKRPAPRLLPEVLQRLLSHAYPGNVRELRNTLERALINTEGDTLGAESIVFAPGVVGGDQRDAGGSLNVTPEPPQTRERVNGADGLRPHAADLGKKFLADLPLNLSEAEDILIARAIAVAEGNLSRAARLLGINRASLYRWQERRSADKRRD